MHYDPYSNTQTRFERTDRSGRWSPIHEPTAEAWWVAVLGGVLAGIVFATLLFWGCAT